MEYNSNNVKIGDLVQAKDEDTWGKVITVGDDAVTALYDDGDEYNIEYWYIASVRTPALRPGADGSTPPPVPPSVAAQVAPSVPKSGIHAPGQPYDGLTVKELVEQKYIWLGKMVTWRAMPNRYRMDVNRLWVILNFTKNSGQKAVNITPLGGAFPGERFNADYESVPITELVPVLFSSPMIKVTKSQG